jgi:hypothetical protein
MMKFLSHFRRPDLVRVFWSADREMLEAAVESVEPTIELLRSNYRLADTAQLSTEASLALLTRRPRKRPRAEGEHA